MPPSPIVSVIMPVYNAGSYLRAAIDSILQQHFRDFELIIVNDGSKDDSQATIDSYTDPRIRAYGQENQGLTKTLNRLVSLANGKYLARMDQDDLSLPDRLTKQVEFLDTHPDVTVVGTWVEVIGPDNKPVGLNRFPVTDTAIKEMLLVKNTFAHGAIMMRPGPDIIYRGEFDYAEDFGLWSYLAKRTALANMPHVLYRWRTSPGGMSAKFAKLQGEARHRILAQYRDFYLRQPQLHNRQPSDAVEIAYRGRLRVMYAKALIALTLAQHGQVRPALEKIVELGRVLFTRGSATIDGASSGSVTPENS